MIRKRCLFSFTKALGVAGALVSLALAPAGGDWLVPQVFAAQSNAQTAKKTTQTKKTSTKKATTKSRTTNRTTKSTAATQKKRAMKSALNGAMNYKISKSPFKSN